MSNKKIKMSRIDINHKFDDFEQAEDHAKKLKSFIVTFCKNRKYKCEAIIGISNIMGKVTNDYYYEKTGKVGKPKIIRDVITDDDKILKKKGKLGYSGPLGNVYVDYHLHVLLISYPGETVRLAIKSYINKNWWRIPKLYDNGLDWEELKKIKEEKKIKKEEEIDELKEVLEKELEENEDTKEKKKVYGKDCNIGYAEYIFEQSESVLFVDVDYSDYKEEMPVDSNLTNFIGERYNCSLKALYYERLRLNTLFHYGHFSRAEKEKEEKYYNEMIKYYQTFCEEYNEKWLKEFIRDKHN